MAVMLAAIALSAALTGIRRRRRIPEVAPNGTKKNPDEGNPDIGDAASIPGSNELLRCTLRRDLGLAAEHLRSIRWLLEIARQHQQPIPSAALTNLDLVSKQLGEMQQKLEAEGNGVQEADLSVLVHRREM